jgi:hypothetical protein
MIIKLLLSNATAGLGTANIFFNTLETSRDSSDADSKDSHNLGAYTMKILKNDRKMVASPIWVRLIRVLGNWPK